MAASEIIHEKKYFSSDLMDNFEINDDDGIWLYAQRHQKILIENILKCL